MTLSEFLEKFSGYDIRFAIELKGPGVEEETLSAVREAGILERTTFTSFRYEYIKRIKELCPAARVGLLTSSTDEKTEEALLAIGAEELAPKAELITEALMEKWRRLGLGVRAWGVFDTALMERMCALGVDGMTVNFPDRLREYLCRA